MKSSRSGQKVEKPPKIHILSMGSKSRSFSKIKNPLQKPYSIYSRMAIGVCVCVSYVYMYTSMDMYIAYAYTHTHTYTHVQIETHVHMVLFILIKQKSEPYKPISATWRVDSALNVPTQLLLLSPLISGTDRTAR